MDITAPITVYRVRDWNDHFENSRSRQIECITWVPLPNHHDGDRYAELMDHENGEAHYGCWALIVQVASKCQQRGTLLKSNGEPHTAQSIARMVRGNTATFEAAISRLLRIGWLEEIDIGQVAPARHPTGTRPSRNGSERTEVNGSEGIEKNGSKRPLLTAAPLAPFLETSPTTNNKSAEEAKQPDKQQQPTPAKAQAVERWEHFGAALRRIWQNDDDVRRLFKWAQELEDGKYLDGPEEFFVRLLSLAILVQRTAEARKIQDWPSYAIGLFNERCKPPDMDHKSGRGAWRRAVDGSDRPELPPAVTDMLKAWTSPTIKPSKTKVA